MEFVVEQGASVVANGSFNPAIFHPWWLVAQGVIKEDEATSASVEITHPEVARFSIPGVHFDIQTEQMTIRVEAEPFIRAADLFYVIFGEKLDKTPITAAGVNYWAHVQLNDYEQRQRFGRKLAPIEPWGEFGRAMEVKGPKGTGGFSTLIMRSVWTDYGDEGAVNVAVQPSARVPNEAGAFIHVNNHFSADAAKESGFPVLVAERFDECLRTARGIIEHLTAVGRGA
jgi:hypothetical protein